MSLSKDDIRSMLMAKCHTKELAAWLREIYFPELKKRFNADDSRKRFGLYQGEECPRNERNLTDVRTRLGVLIEFEIARISNEMLSEFGINDLFWSYVVANRFPDLEVRNNDGNRFLRIEVKCLQCIAEEKSANFDTLLKDTDPHTDYVVVCTWDWSHNKSKMYDWDAVPLIDRIYVFHAYSLALMRDAYWLNRPPKDLGRGYQGFDIRYAVTCRCGKYAKEQGNYGKLMRIWDEKFKFRPKESEVLRDTEREYLIFKDEIIERGFRLLAEQHLFACGGGRIMTIHVNKISGYASGDLAYFMCRGDEASECLSFAVKHGISRVVIMRENYKSNVYSYKSGVWNVINRDIKPKNVVKALRPCES